MADEREMEEELFRMIHGGQQEHEEEDDGSQYLTLEQGEQEIGDDNASEVVK